MTFRLDVVIPEQEAISFELPDGGDVRLGSHESCELQVEHDEVADRAAQIEVRGEAVFLRNLNPFPIYVGEHEVASNEQTEWPVGQTVLLTRSVSLVVVNLATAGVETAAELKAKKNRQTIQIAMIAVCAVASMFMLSGDSEPVEDSTQALGVRFTEDLVAEWSSTVDLGSLNADQKRVRQTALNYLIDARTADVRWGRERPSDAIGNYELLLDSPLLRNAKPGSLEERVQSYALARVNDLSARLGMEDF